MIYLTLIPFDIVSNYFNINNSSFIVLSSMTKNLTKTFNWKHCTIPVVSSY